jgi:hypothetical protein
MAGSPDATTIGDVNLKLRQCKQVDDGGNVSHDVNHADVIL